MLVVVSRRNRLTCTISTSLKPRRLLGETSDIWKATVFNCSMTWLRE